MSEDGKGTYQRLIEKGFGIIDGPVTFFKESVIDPIRAKNKTYYYHRQFRRVPTIDECIVGDEVCIYEANEQYKRDRLVDGEVIKILRRRRIECEHFHGYEQKTKKCAKEIEDYEEAAGNWFCKYGDMGGIPNVREAYMKQKHRLLWERRYGPVGTGMNRKTEQQ